MGSLGARSLADPAESAARARWSVLRRAAWVSRSKYRAFDVGDVMGMVMVGLGISQTRFLAIWLGVRCSCSFSGFHIYIYIIYIYIMCV